MVCGGKSEGTKSVMGTAISVPSLRDCRRCLRISGSQLSSRAPAGHAAPVAESICGWRRLVGLANSGWPEAYSAVSREHAAFSNV